LQRVISDVAIGSLLVQSESRTGEPLLFQVKLPNCIRERHRAVNTWVFLLDAQARCVLFLALDLFSALTFTLILFADRYRRSRFHGHPSSPRSWR
jgi:hypothetical protein